MYSVVLTTVIAIVHYWGILKLNLVETLPWWFSGLFTSTSLLTRVVAWLIAVLKLADDSNIAQIIISNNSKSECKQMKVSFCRNHGCFGGLCFHWKWNSLCTAKICRDPATHWYTEKRGKSLSGSSNIPSLASGKLLCNCASSSCIESYRVSGRFSNWVVRVYFFDFISLLFLALTWLQTKTTLL